MKKLTDVIKSLNEHKNVITYTHNELLMCKYVDESLREKIGYSKELSTQISEDLKRMFPDNFEDAKKYFDQNFQ